jgi:hypothetical protein
VLAVLPVGLGLRADRGGRALGGAGLLADLGLAVGARLALLGVRDPLALGDDLVVLGLDRRGTRVERGGLLGGQRVALLTLGDGNDAVDLCDERCALLEQVASCDRRNLSMVISSDR